MYVTVVSSTTGVELELVNPGLEDGESAIVTGAWVTSCVWVIVTLTLIVDARGRGQVSVSSTV